MKNIGMFAIVALFVLAACAPAAVPAAEPIFYRGARADVYAAVVQAISTSPGIDGSNGWIITQSDAAGGFIRAETVVTVVGFLSTGTRQEGVSVVVSETGDRTQVIIQGTSGARDLMTRVRNELDSKFNRA